MVTTSTDRYTIITADSHAGGSHAQHREHLERRYLDEGTYPFTREHLRQVFPGVPEGDMRRVLGENAAALYGFDLAALAPHAAAHGPTVAELARPLDALPEHPNEAMLKGASGAAR